MKYFYLPCGLNKIKLFIPDNIETKVLKPKEVTVIKNVQSAIKHSILNPIGEKRIKDFVKQNHKIAIIITDSTRNVPENIIVNILLDELEKIGLKMKQVTVINALGTHNPDTIEELTKNLGSRVMNRVNVINHDCKNINELRDMGRTKINNIPIIINKIVAEADVRITTGIIEPHLLAGYSGGVKTLSVGVAGIETLSATHNINMFMHPKTHLGVIKDNIFRDFLNETAMSIGIDFIINVVQDGHKNIVGVFAGEPIKTFNEGVKKAREVFEVDIDKQYDIVVSIPGYPKSSDLYQATRAWNNIVFGPRPIVKEGGTIIIPAPCEKGFGQLSFYDWLAEAKSPSEVIQRANKFGFSPGDHKAFVAARVLEKYNVYITDCLIPREKILKMHFKYKKYLQLAINELIEKKGNLSILIIPYGLITLPCLDCTNKKI